MELQDRISQQIASSIQIQQAIKESLSELIGYASSRMVNALLNDKKILACGNGRSATAAQLLVLAMLNKYDRDRPSLPAIALSAEIATLTAIASPHHFDDIFAMPVRALGQNGDLLVVYMDSRQCPNITHAIRAAHDKDISVIALTGLDGSIATSLLHESDIEIQVPAQLAARVHEAHILITHCLCDLIDHQLFG